VANCFATDQSSAFVEASLGDCCCQRQSIQNTLKGWERLDGGIKRIGCVSKANTSKGWKRIDCGIKRIGCVSTVRSGSTRQTDRLWFSYDRRFGVV
jgi:hypothetical protein